MFPRMSRFDRFAASAGRPAGITATGCGKCGVFLIYWSAVLGFAGGGAIPKCFRSAIPLDFWRVEALEENRKLLLAAEMKLPGRAWLEFAS